MPYDYTDDGQNQGTYVVVDDYGQHQSSIGLTLDGAMRLKAALNAEELHHRVSDGLLAFSRFPRD